MAGCEKCWGHLSLSPCLIDCVWVVLTNKLESVQPRNSGPLSQSQEGTRCLNATRFLKTPTAKLHVQLLSSLLQAPDLAEKAASAAPSVLFPCLCILD